MTNEQTQEQNTIKGVSNWRKTFHPFKILSLKAVEDQKTRMIPQDDKTVNYARAVTYDGKNVSTYDSHYKLSSSLNGEITHLSDKISLKNLERFLDDCTSEQEKKSIQYIRIGMPGRGYYPLHRAQYKIRIFDECNGLRAIVIDEKMTPNSQSYGGRYY